MLKSIFGKKNRKDSLPVQNEDENSFPQSDTVAQEKELPFREVLNHLYESLDPSDPDGYAVAVAEVEYLWARYQQFCGTSHSLKDEVLLQEPFKHKPFLRQVWNTIPRDTEGNMTFAALFGVLKWWGSVDQETKLRGIFKLLNTGQPLDITAIRHIVKTLGPTLNEESVNRKADLLMAHLDDKNQGYIDEEQWIEGIRSTLSDEEIKELTKVVILPLSPSTQPPTNTQSLGSPVSNELLITISSKISENHWKQLAHELGFGDKDLKALERHFPGRSREQVYQLLKHWQEKEEYNKHALEMALKKCGMDEVLSVLQHE